MTRRSVGALCAALALGLLPQTGRAAPSGFTVDDIGGMLLRVELATGSFVSVGPTGLPKTETGGILYNIEGLAYDPTSGVLFAFSDSTSDLISINPHTGAASVVGPLGLSQITGIGTGGLTFDDTGRLLLSAGDTSNPGSSLYEVDPATGAAVFIGSHGMSTPIEAIAYGKGALFGVTTFPDLSLYQIDSATGTASFIGTLGASIGGQIGMSFDSGGTLWLVDEDGLAIFGNVYTVNTGTGQATLQAPTAAYFESFESLAIPITTTSVPALGNPGLVVLAGVLVCIAFTALASWARHPAGG